MVARIILGPAKPVVCAKALTKMAPKLPDRPINPLIVRRQAVDNGRRAHHSQNPMWRMGQQDTTFETQARFGHIDEEDPRPGLVGRGPDQSISRTAWAARGR
jgi:hypothetical protein